MERELMRHLEEETQQTMYIYIESEHEYIDDKLHQLFTVGFYDPNGKFVPESDWSTSTEAAARVHYLNGEE